MADRKALGPIPGMSLTQTPKNAPWERPPETSNPETALHYHIERLENPDVMDAALHFLEVEDVPLTALTRAIVRSGVAKGIHSIDVGLLVAPAVHEFLKQTADAVGVEYDEGLENKEEKEKLAGEMVKAKARKMLEKVGAEMPDMAEVTEVEPEAMEEEPMVKEPMMMEEQPKGLMSRRAM